MDSSNPPPGGGTPLRGNRILIIQNENVKLKQKINDLQLTIDNILCEMQQIKQENVELKEHLQYYNGGEYEQASGEANEQPYENEAVTNQNVNALNPNTEVDNIISDQFQTDEDELERETNWILQRSKKGKSKLKEMNGPSENTRADSVLIDETSNQQQEIIQKPPPINIVGISNYARIKEILNSAHVQNYSVIALNNNIWKINTSNPDGYKALSATLNEMKAEWYTYENKNERPNKVIIRGLHHTCTKEEIMEDLRHQGFNPIDAVNILKKERNENGNTYSYRQLPLFRVTFHNDDSTDKIYNIETIAQLKVKVEALKAQSKLIPQCKRCQGFNHTKHYCQREARCVKCAGKHATDQCELPKSIAPKCINCQGNHPASYRGCEVAKELQKIRNKSRSIKTTPNSLMNQELPKPTQQVFQQQVVQHTNNSGQPIIRQNTRPKTYSEALTSNIPSVSSTSQNVNILNEILKNMEKINSRLEFQAELNQIILNKINAIVVTSHNKHN